MAQVYIVPLQHTHPFIEKVASRTCRLMNEEAVRAGSAMTAQTITLASTIGQDGTRNSRLGFQSQGASIKNEAARAGEK